MSTLLLILLLQASPAHAVDTPASPPPAAAEAAEGHAATEAEGGHEDPATVIMHHATDQPFLGLPSKHMVFFLLAAFLVILGAQLAVRSYGAGGVPHLSLIHI